MDHFACTVANHRLHESRRQLSLLFRDVAFLQDQSSSPAIGCVSEWLIPAHTDEGPGMKSGLGTIYYYFPDFAYETKNLRQRMSAL